MKRTRTEAMAVGHARWARECLAAGEDPDVELFNPRQAARLMRRMHEALAAEGHGPEWRPLWDCRVCGDCDRCMAE
jgi:hypothetical protein